MVAHEAGAFGSIIEAMARLSLLLHRLSALKPDILLNDITALQPSYLEQKQIRYLVLDVDNTLVEPNGTQINQTRREFLQHLLELDCIDGIYLASNSRRDLSALSASIGAQVIHSTRLSRKPLRHHYNRILREIGGPPASILMIGDRLMTDILGGNLAGMHTALVMPVVPRNQTRKFPRKF